MDVFTQKFGEFNEAKGTWAIQQYFLSLPNSLPYIGFAFGLLLGSSISNKFGRRMCMFTMCLWAIVGALIMVTAEHKAQVLAGRVVANVYIGMELAVVPVTQSELVPAQVRGFIVGTYQSGLLLGHLISSLVCRGTSSMNNDASWKIHLGILFIIPCMVGSGIWFIPELPRWLLTRNRPEEALASLRKLRRGRFTKDEIEQEMRELETSLELNGERGRFIDIFKGTNLKRTLIVVGVNLFLQLTGQNSVSLYGTIFIKSLHIVNAFSLQDGIAVINIFIGLLCQFLSDMTGRKPLMAVGAVIQVGALFSMGDLGTIANPLFAIKGGITAMLPIFGIGFQLGWAPLSHVVAAEIPTTRLGDETYAFDAIFNIVIQFAVSFSIPYLLYDQYAGLHSKVGFIFGSFVVCCVIFTVLCIPECGGKTLEQIDEMLKNGLSIRQFGKDDRHILVKLDGEKGEFKAEETEREGKGQ